MDLPCVILFLLLWMVVGINACTNTTCESCVLNTSCSWCINGSQQSCMPTTTCTSMGGASVSSCSPNYTTCVPAPTSNQCLFPANSMILRETQSKCIGTNTLIPTVPETNTLCGLAQYQDGLPCLQAIEDWRCSFDCGGTCPNPLTFDNVNFPQPCLPVCNRVIAACPNTNNAGCFTFLSCMNSSICYNLLPHSEVQLTFSTITPTPTSPTYSTSPITTNSAANFVASRMGSALNIGVIIGPVVGGVFFVVIVVIVGFFLIRRSRQRNHESSTQVESTTYNAKEFVPKAPYGGNYGEGYETTMPVPMDPPSDQIAVLGVKVDKWEIKYEELKIQDQLGQGSFGITYAGVWRNARVVIKTAKVLTEAAFRDFCKEMDNMKTLRPHPNVCLLLGVCTNPISIIMELVPRGSLDKLLADAKFRLDLKLATQMMKDAASGIAHLHSENIIHCDIACRNLLVTEQYSIKVSDFGMSKYSLSGTYRTEAEKPFPIRWTSPEAMVTRSFSKASDVWSFGVVMWEILERKYPYGDMDNSQVIKAVTDERHPYRLHKPQTIACPDRLYHLMLKCWERDSNQRPTYAQICEFLNT